MSDCSNSRVTPFLFIDKSLVLHFLLREFTLNRQCLTSRIDFTRQFQPCTVKTLGVRDLEATAQNTYIRWFLSLALNFKGTAVIIDFMVAVSAH